MDAVANDDDEDCSFSGIDCVVFWPVRRNGSRERGWELWGAAVIPREGEKEVERDMVSGFGRS